MERDDRPPVGTFFVEQPLASTRSLELGDRANQHARVKRIQDGDTVRLIDGAGGFAVGHIAPLRRGSYHVDIDRVERAPRPRAIHLRVPIGDRDRMLWLAEKATELGVESWQGVLYHRSRSVAPRGEGEGFAAKLRVRMIGAMEQSGGVWLPRLLPDATVEAIDIPPNATRIVLDRDAGSLLPVSDSSEFVITFGPEGGLESSERSALIDRGWRPTSLADGTLRFETAGIAAMAVIRAAQIPQEAKRG